MPSDKRPVGRPSEYTKELADLICTRMENGETLREICRDEAMPSRQTVLNWCDKHDEFVGQYARAREALQDYWADEIVEIADDASNDWMTKEGVDVVNSEHINRSRLRIDSRKWLMSKLAPKRFGDKITQEITGENGGPAILQIVTKVEK